MASAGELIEKPFFAMYKPSACCYSEKFKYEKQKPYKIHKNPPIPDAQYSEIELYFLSPLKQKKPTNSCKTSACKALLYNIDNAKTSIDFAIYGIQGQDKIYNALVNAQKRGLKIRWVTDMSENNENIYADTTSLMKAIQNVKNDFRYHKNEITTTPTYFEFPYTAIMHNKFFIFDNEKVYTGSTNISSTCLTGYNANVSVLIHSPQIADYYTKEFEQMYSGKFHNDKINKAKPSVKIDDMNVSIYFSPTDKVTTKKIIPLIQFAQKYVYIPAFYLTHKELTNSLIEARNKGVDVRVLLDETSIQGEYTTKKQLESANIKVKIEHWRGKMHQKTILIDDNTLIIGSMNFTSQGENRNDENTVIITNAPQLTIAYKKHFLELWNSIKDDRTSNHFHFLQSQQTVEHLQED